MTNLPPSGRYSARLIWNTKQEEQPGPAQISFLAEELVIPQQVHPPAGRVPNRLICGDNLLALQGLLAQGYEGRIKLIYIDPPFYSQTNYTHRVIPDGELPVIELPAYHDTWSGGMDAYLDMLYPRLQLMHRFLAPDGSIYVHLDASISHYIKVLMDEIFGPDSFQREIIWRIGWISGYKSAARNWVRNHDTLLFYVQNPGKFTFNKEYIPYPPGYRRRGGIETTGKGYPLEDVWNANPFEFELKGEESLDSIQIKSFSHEKSGFATQKNKSLLRRIIKASSNPGDLVADFFCGSGTTLVVAEELGRRWLGCEIGRTGIQVTRKRLVAAGAGPFSIERVKQEANPVHGSGLSLNPDPCPDLNNGTVHRIISPLTASTKTSFNEKGCAIKTGDQPALRLTRPEIIGVSDAREQITIGLESYTLAGAPANPRRRKAKADWENLMSRARQDFSILIDYWAVDWDYDGSCFRSRWQAWKGYNKKETMPRQATALLPPGKPRTIAVQVVDIFGNEVIVTVNVPRA